MEEGSIYQRMRDFFMEEGMDQELDESVIGLLKNIYKYLTKDAKDIMTHRTDIVAIDEDVTLEEAVKFMLGETFSRFPIYRESIDEIVGTIHLREAVALYFETDMKDKSLNELLDLLRPVAFIPETKSIDSLFKQMQEEKNHITIVLDEYGQTSGLVAMEDILEEIVGNIVDEHDDEEEAVEEQVDGSYIVDGLTELEDVEELIPVEFDKSSYGTLNGFLIDQLERIPSKDEECVVYYKDYMFTVLDVDNNRIEKVKIEKSLK
ncbi:MAG: hemolysin family protein [Suipraeoptans sp.]